MSYQVGVDLGTTYSAAAVARDGRAEIVTLGYRGTVIPSILFVRDDGVILVGEAAERRGVLEPERSAREFKRRVGDPTPILVGAAPWKAQDLMAAMLGPILATVIERQGGTPDHLVLTHPAGWSAARAGLFLDALAGDSLPPTTLLTEPEAAAIHYAASERIEVGEIVAVYDLGGGTFDSAVLRRTAESFEIVGRPEGIDRLGGVDFDAAVFTHVNRNLDGLLDGLDMADATVAAGVARLRADCVDAKEALSADTDVVIPVVLPDLRTEVRMTRSELEAMIRPAVTDSIGALQRALRTAEVTPDDVHSVLLVGGSSRIPLVAQMVGAELGRPVSVDAHPKHAIALGAALAAAAAHGAIVDVAEQTVTATPEVVIPPSVAAAEVLGDGTVPFAASPPSVLPKLLVPEPVLPEPVLPEPAIQQPVSTQPRPVADAPVADAPVVFSPTSAQPPLTQAAGVAALSVGGQTSSWPEATDTALRPDKARSSLPLIVAVVGALVLVAVAAIFVLRPDSTTSDPSATAEATAAESSSTTGDAATEVVSVPVPEVQCADPGDEVFVCIKSVTVDAAGNLIAPFETINFDALIGPPPNRHVHFYFPVGSMAANQLNAGPFGPEAGSWVIWDEPAVFGPGGKVGAYTLTQAQDVGATELCALVASDEHEVFPGTGNCVPINLTQTRDASVATGATSIPSAQTAATPITTTSTTTTSVAPTTTIPDVVPEAECPDPGSARFVCIRSVTVDENGVLVAPYETFNYEPVFGPAPNRHIHFFFPTRSVVENPLNAGASGPNAADWVIWAAGSPFGPGDPIGSYTAQDAIDVGASELCALVATSEHAVEPATGNCVAIRF